MNTQNYDNTIIKYEQEVLSILLVNESLMNECELETKDFRMPLNQRLYHAMLQVYKKDKVLDIMSIIKLLEDIQGISEYIADLVGHYVTSNNFHLYVSKIQEANNVEKTKKIVEKLSNEEITFEEMIEEINKINSNRKEETTSNMLGAQDIYELITTDNNKLEFNSFDWLQSRIGFIEKTVNIIAARTSVGKSAFALNLMCDLARKYKCLFINMEMTEKEVYQRMVSIESSVAINNFKHLTKEQNQRVMQAINVVRNKKIKIFNGSKSVAGLRKILARETREEHCVVFIDYIGYVTTGKKQNDRERIGEAVRSIQTMSKDYNCTIFIVAQINRDGTDTPNLTHLKDSGELEQTGHAILILHNPEKDLNNQTPQYEIIVAKNRSGRLGKIYAMFDKPTQKIYEVANRG